MIAEPSMLESRDLGRRHPDGRQWLLDGVSIRVGGGDRVAVVGASGSGKTLLLRALTLLDPIDRGEVRWHGRPVRRDSIPAFRGQAIYMHQRPALGGSTVEASLRQPFTLNAHRRRQFDQARVVGHLRELGRDASFLEKQIRDLSGGESQVAALVRAIQLDPDLLLLDEPTAALDVPTAQAAEQLILRWVSRSAGARAVVWVTHDATQARRVGEQIVEITSGRLVRSE